MGRDLLLSQPWLLLPTAEHTSLESLTSHYLTATASTRRTSANFYNPCGTNEGAIGCFLMEESEVMLKKVTTPLAGIIALSLAGCASVIPDSDSVSERQIQTSTMELSMSTGSEPTVRQGNVELELDITPGTIRSDVNYTIDASGSTPLLDKLFSTAKGVYTLNASPQREGGVLGDVSFEMKTTNLSERILRFDRSAVAIIADGEEIMFSEVPSGMVRPEGGMNAFQVSADGGALLNADDLRIALYDVVVQKNEAGAPTRMANFEWALDVSGKKESVTAYEFEATRTMPKRQGAQKVREAQTNPGGHSEEKARDFVLE